MLSLQDREDKGAKTMYKPIGESQHSFLNFNQPLGRHMNPDNRWMKLADLRRSDHSDQVPVFRP